MMQQVTHSNINQARYLLVQPRFNNKDAYLRKLAISFTLDLLYSRTVMYQ